MRRWVSVVLLSLLAACSGGDEAKVAGPTRTVVPTTGTVPHVALGVEIVLETPEVAPGEPVRGFLRSFGSETATTTPAYELARRIGDELRPHPLEAFWGKEIVAIAPGARVRFVVPTDGLPHGDWQVKKTFTSERGQGSVQAAADFTITRS